MEGKTEKRFACVQHGSRAVEFLLSRTPGQNFAGAFFSILKRAPEGDRVVTRVYWQKAPYFLTMATLRQSTLQRYPTATFDF